MKPRSVKVGDEVVTIPGELFDMEKARQAVLNTPVAERAARWNKEAEETGDHWRYAVDLPHTEFVRRMRSRTAAIKDFTGGGNLLGWMTTSQRMAFHAMALMYSAIPLLTIIALAFFLGRWILVLALPVTLIAVMGAGAPRKSLLRSCLILATLGCLIFRGYADSLTLILGIPTLAALFYRWADNLGSQSLIHYLEREPDGYKDLVDKGLVMVMIDSRC